MTEPKKFTIRNDNYLEWTGDPYQRSALDKRYADYLGNKFRADMWFHVLRGNVKIPAHRFVIGAASPVLETIAYGTGDIAGSIGDVPVRDCSADDFYEVLRFVYTNVVNLTAFNAADILLLAHYYNLQSLEDKCIALLMGTLCVRNVCNIFGKIHLLDNRLKAVCLRTIQSNTDALFAHRQNLFDLDVEALSQVFKMNTLCIGSEVDLFEQLLKWGRIKCVLKLRQLTARNLRETLEGRIDFVRFAAMSPDQFSQCLRMVESTFFSDGEISGTFQRIAGCKGGSPASAQGLTHYTIPRRFHLAASVISFDMFVLREVSEFGFSIRCNCKHLLYGFAGTTTKAPFTVEVRDQYSGYSTYTAAAIGVQMFGEYALLNEPIPISSCKYLYIKYAAKVKADFTIESRLSWHHINDGISVESLEGYPLYTTFRHILISKTD